MNSGEKIKISKFLSLVLRHSPETVGIVLDENGWTNVDILIEKSNLYGIKLDKIKLKQIVETNSKKRFAFNKTFDNIRANQGHSVKIDLGYKPCKPPYILYHGTGEKSADSILQTGIYKQDRHHVHLSSTVETALQVGQRHGKPVVFEVLSEQMYNDKYEFFLSENGVWLTEYVPVKYLKKTILSEL
jgi:putative RNA 2'-phosphotransferase